MIRVLTPVWLHILSILLIQKGQLSVTDKSMKMLNTDQLLRRNLQRNGDQNDMTECFVSFACIFVLC